MLVSNPIMRSVVHVFYKNNLERRSRYVDFISFMFTPIFSDRSFHVKRIFVPCFTDHEESIGCKILLQDQKSKLWLLLLKY